MAKRVRRTSEPGEFKDPLKDYDGPDYVDNLQRSLAEGAVTDIQCTPFIGTSSDTTVQAAIKLMAEKDIGSLMIVDNDRVVGIFSERDALVRVSIRYEEIKDEPIRDFMTPNPIKVSETETPAAALNLMAHHSFRHVPIVDVDEKLVGMIGPRRVTRYLQSYFSEQ